MRKYGIYSAEDVETMANRIAKRKLISLAIGGTAIALTAIAGITYHVCRQLATDKNWNSMDWNLDDEITLL